MTVVIFDINMNIRVILWMLLLAQEWLYFSLQSE